MHELNTNLWYVCVEDKTVGPVSTELVIKGIEHRKIPFEAVVCVAGGTTWVSMSTIEVFHAAVLRSYPPPPPDSEEARIWLTRGFVFPKPAPLPRAEELLAPYRLAAVAIVEDHTDDDFEVEVDETPIALTARVGAAPAIDWSRGFHPYFLPTDGLQLPDERALLESLASAPRAVFLHDEALWNLALCLAHGSDRLGEAAANVFFASVLEHGQVDRLQWMSRTLLSTGFVPSGLGAAEGMRAFERLRALCPVELSEGPLRRVA